MGRFGHGWRIFTLVAACILALSVAASATTYYIDYAAGSDSNSGTSTAAPWQHMSGMHGCIANYAKTTPKAGDSIILKGGVTWPNAAFPILWSWSGTSTSDIYIGVDQTWYAGSSWTRPIFDAQDQVIGGSWNMFFHCVYSGVHNVTLDNIEMKGIYWSGAPAYGHLAYITANTASEIHLKNLYLHRWTHDSIANGTSDYLKIVLGDTNSPYCSGCSFDSGAIDNTDGDSNSGAAFYAFGSVTNSVVHDLSNGLLLGAPSSGTLFVTGNLVYNIMTSFTGVHENILETIGPNTGTVIVANNVFHDSVGESSFLGGPTTEVDYYFNNVLYNLWNEPEFCSRSSCGSVHAWNNTIVPRSGQPCFHQGHSGPKMVVADFRNNHCITTSSVIEDNISATTLITSSNTMMTPTKSAAQGYSTGNYYAPTSKDSSTVGAGVNFASQCSGNISGLCTAVSIVSPPSPGPLRPNGSAAWDSGAYLYSAGGAAPAAPKGLTAVVH